VKFQAAHKSHHEYIIIVTEKEGITDYYFRLFSITNIHLHPEEVRKKKPPTMERRLYSSIASRENRLQSLRLRPNTGPIKPQYGTRGGG
jgi:hypothetical protein